MDERDVLVSLRPECPVPERTWMGVPFAVTKNPTRRRVTQALMETLEARGVVVDPLTEEIKVAPRPRKTREGRA